MRLEFPELKYKREQRIEDYQSKRFIGCLRYQVSWKVYGMVKGIHFWSPRANLCTPTQCFFFGGERGRVRVNGKVIYPYLSHLLKLPCWSGVSILLLPPWSMLLYRSLHPPSLDPYHLYGCMYLPFVPSLLTRLRARKPNLWTFSRQ